MNPSFRIEIPRRSPNCCHGQENFQPGMEYHSFLTEDEKGNLLRKDYCESCWKEAAGEGRVTSWSSKVPTKKGGKRLPIDRNERALELLKESLSKEEAPEAFVLALFLARSRYAALRKELPEGTSLYEVLATEEMLVVPRVKLSTLQIATIQARLAERFSLEAAS